MARKIVTVDETTLLLPTAVSNALKADLDTAFTTAKNTATAAASTATAAKDTAVAAAATATAPTDTTMASKIADTTSATRGALNTVVNSAVNAATASEVARADALYSRGEIGYAEIKTATAALGAGAVQDVPGLSITVTVGSKPITVEAFIDTQKTNATAGFMIAYIYEGATQLQQAEDYRADLQPTTLRPAVRLTPSAGTHTYKIRVLATGAGGMTVNGAAGVPCWIRASEQ